MTNKIETGKAFKTFRDLKTISQKSESASSLSSRTSIPSSTRYTSSTSIREKQETSPVRDFQKIPNSVTRDALPQGTFRGKSKHVFDYLWSVSRGAIVPTRFVKKSRREIKQGSGLGSMVTVDAALNHLEAIGLIKVNRAVGSLTGNHYEIFAPDEIDLASTSISSISSISSPTQKVDILDILESSNTSTTQTDENTDTYSHANTIFKTLNLIDDDSPITDVLEMLNEAAKRATGKDLTEKDFEALKDIVEIIITETDLARSRTHSVSVYLKLAAENLRRRLYSKPKGKPPAKSFESGKQAPVNAKELPADQLDDELKNTILDSLRQMAKTNGRESVEFFKDNYTAEDWQWLTERLKADDE